MAAINTTIDHFLAAVEGFAPREKEADNQ